MKKKSKNDYRGLVKKKNLKIRQELIETDDYLHKLNHEEKEWLNKFNLEYVSADFRPAPGHTKKLHKTKKLRKSCTDANNHRNNDVYSVSKTNNMLKGEKKIDPGMNLNRSTNPKEVEDVLITVIDLKDKIKRTS